MKVAAVNGQNRYLVRRNATTAPSVELGTMMGIADKPNIARLPRHNAVRGTGRRAEQMKKTGARTKRPAQSKAPYFSRK